MRGKQASLQGCKVASSSFQCHSFCSWPNPSPGLGSVCVWCMAYVCVCLKLLGVGVVKIPTVPGGPLPVFFTGQQLLLPLALVGRG